MDSEYTAVCKLTPLCGQAAEFKPLLDVQECFGLVPAVT